MTRLTALTSGSEDLDAHLGGLKVGDNVIWYDDAGSLAWSFCHKLLSSSIGQDLPLIYVSYDRSPKNLLDKLGDLAHSPRLTVLDCFTHGKGESAELFTRFYANRNPEDTPAVEVMRNPADPAALAEAFYQLCARLGDGVRFVVESLTGMKDLWGGEEAVTAFYRGTCPRLYELDTVAYWVCEKKAHSPRFRAEINQIGQVVIELALKRGNTSLTVIKAENRQVERLGKPVNYWVEGGGISLSGSGRGVGPLALGAKIKKTRMAKGLSQNQLARLIGVTASNISQVESNQILPSLPALFRMAEVLGVDPAHFLQQQDPGRSAVFPESQAGEALLAQNAARAAHARLLVPSGVTDKLRPLLIELSPESLIEGHFLRSKGDEMGYVLSGRGQMSLEGQTLNLQAGDTIYLAKSLPDRWNNQGSEPLRMLWLNLA